MIKSVKDLDVFKKAHKLTVSLYKNTKKFPKHEKYGIVNQIRRASSSINANLLEGSHRNTRGEYKQLVGIARGSVGELKYHLLLAKDLGYIPKEKYEIYEKEINEVSKMLNGLVKSLS